MTQPPDFSSPSPDRGAPAWPGVSLIIVGMVWTGLGAMVMAVFSQVFENNMGSFYMWLGAVLLAIEVSAFVTRFGMRIAILLPIVWVGAIAIGQVALRHDFSGMLLTGSAWASTVLSPSDFIVIGGGTLFSGLGAFLLLRRNTPPL